MPLALLLRNTLGALDKGVRSLEGWNQLAFLEELVIARARSGFLVRWFGKGLPTHQAHLRIAIGNLGALRKRWEIVTLPRVPQPSGLNLTEPLAGMAGTVFGALFSPTGLVIAGVVGLHAVGGTACLLANLLLALMGTLLGSLLAGLSPILHGLVGVAFPVAAVGALFLAAEPVVQDVYLFLGALAEALDALLPLLDQLLGPRSGVRNPLLLGLLGVLDNLAQLLPHALALVAVAVVDSLPVLRDLRVQLPLLFAFTKSVMAAVAAGVADLLDGVLSLLKGPNSVMGTVRGVVAGLKEAGGLIRAAIGLQLADGGKIVEEWWDTVKPMITGWWDAVGKQAKAWVEGFPVVATLQWGMENLKMAQTVFTSAAARAAAAKPPAPPAPAAPAAPAAPSGSGGPGVGAKILGGLAWLFGTATPSTTPPTLPDLPDTKMISSWFTKPPALGSIPIRGAVRGVLRRVLPFGELFFPDPFALSPATLAAVERARNPASVFAAERLRLKAERGTPEQQTKAFAEDLRLRSALYTVVETLMPAAARARLGELDDVFQAADAVLYDRKVRWARFEPPVKEILESRRLRPVVKRVRVRVRGQAERPAVQAWADALAGALAKQRYLAEA